MEPTLRKSSSVEQTMKLMRHNGAVERRAVQPSEDEIPLGPLFRSTCALGQLPCAMGPDGARDCLRHYEHPPTAAGLWFNKSELTVHSLKLLGDSHVTQVQVDVAPPEAEGFSLSEAHGESYRIQCLKAISLDGLQEQSGLIAREGSNFEAFHSWTINEGGGIPRHNSPTEGLIECAPKGASDVTN